MTADGEDSNYGRLLEFISSQGERKKWAMPMSLLAGDGNEILEHLYDEGLEIAYPLRKKILSYISSAKTDHFLGCATHTGWHSPETFVLPDSVIGKMECGFRLQRRTPSTPRADKWKAGVNTWRLWLAAIRS